MLSIATQKNVGTNSNKTNMLKFLQPKPRFIIIAGSSGAGKTYYANQVLLKNEKNKKKYHNLNSDKIAEEMGKGKYSVADAVDKFKISAAKKND